MFSRICAIFWALLLSAICGCVDNADTYVDPYVEQVRANTHEWEIIHTYYTTHAVGDSIQYLYQGDPVGGAVVGAGGAYVLGFGPVGIIIGAALGASESKPTEVNIPQSNQDRLLVRVAHEQDTCVFEIVDPPKTTNRSRFSKDIQGKYNLLLFFSLRPGIKIRIASSKPLPPIARIWCGFIYLPGEKIPYLDQQR